MAVTLQLRKGTTAENDAFTGAVGEVTVDTTTNTLRVHDGTTAGGTIAGKTYTAGTGITLTGDQFSISDNGIGASQLKVADNGTSGQVLISDGDGTFSWQSLAGGTGVTYSNGTFSIGQSVASTDDVTFNNITANGNTVVNGNLTVNGTTTSVVSNTVELGDNIIELNADLPSDTAPTEDAGFVVNRGSSTNKSLVWDENNDRWTVGNDAFVASEFVGNITGNVTGTVSDVSNHTTDDLTEGASNLYFTDSRARSAISVSGDLSYSSSTGVISFTERTDSQVRSLFSASGDVTYDSNTGTFSATTYKSTDFDTDFGTKSTDDLTEGTSNLYYTDARVRGSLSAGGDLSYDSSTGIFTVTTYKSTDFDTDFGSKSTDDLTEGTTNLYYSNTLVDTHLSGGTGVTYSSGTISIGQDVSTTSDVTFNNVTVDGTLTSDDITAATVTTSGNLTVQGDLTINGTTTTVNSNVVEIGDSILTLNADLGSTTAPSQNGGITINRGSSVDKSFVWDEAADKWTIGTDTLVAGTVEADVTGTVSDISNHSTDDLSEGSSNLYYTDARVDSRIGNGTLTINPGNSLTGGGTFSANQSSNSTITINHADTSSQGSVNNSGNTFIQDITVDGFGHITGINSGSVSGFAQENTAVTFTTVTANDFNSTSDIRKKTNIETINDASTKISNLRGVSFNWADNGEPSIGLIAQELEEVIPEVVSSGEDGFKTVSYGNLIGLLIEAIKDQQNQIDDLARQLYK